VHHVIGNHCLAVGRRPLLERLGIPEPGFYQTPLARGWRLVVLDTTELSTHSKYDEVRCHGALFGKKNVVFT
jgi:hypothetical protein